MLAKANWKPRVQLRPGRRSDAAALADLVNFAGEGLPECVWAKMAAPGQSPKEVGCARAARDEGEFSYRNAIMAEFDEDPCAGCLIGFRIADEPAPISEDLPAMFRPLQELENMALGTWYVNVLAVYPDYRNFGLGSVLLENAETIARDTRPNNAGHHMLSIIVSDANSGAMRLYERCGFIFAGMRPMVKDGWQNPGLNWILLTKRLG